MDKLVSVVIPIYNKEATLEKCVRSVQEQTYTNIEIILVNDGSTDDSRDICEKLKKSDKRIKVAHKKNEGVSIARNIGMEMSRGEYLAFIDPDDWVASNYFEKLLRTSLDTNSDIVSCCAMVVFDDSQNEYKNSFFRMEYGEVGKERAIAQLLSNEYYNDSDKFVDIGVPWGKLYKMDFLKNNSIEFKGSLRRNQDNIFNLYAFQHANKLVYIDTPLYYYDYGHMDNFNTKLTIDALSLYTDLALETQKFYLKYYSDNKLITELTKSKIFKLFVWILSKKLSHKEYNIDLNERLKMINQLTETTPFKEVLAQQDIEYLSGNHRLIHYLTKRKSFRTIFSIFIFKYYSNKLREKLKKINLSIDLLKEL